ncbi:uncharacterized protein LOC125941948 [Dermacentor silvarum]|uniref:uncharacterized protein LOC125941948 n=1 Tax=Dermacentor silvarum TaxID=543639 RepID=UPI0021019418|nr:uncharacterized protein LOC125941948 [Dermacentor silvarum]
MPPRVQRFFLRILKYNYTIVFIPGKQMALADMLSRAPAPGDGTATDTTDVEIHAVSVVSSLVSERTALRLAQVDQLRDLSTNSVTERLGAMFSRYGIPTEVCTDNGPQFSSQVFARFAKLYDFQHVTSSPRFPRSNGLAEKGVQVVKRILKKSTEATKTSGLVCLATEPAPWKMDGPLANCFNEGVCAPLYLTSHRSQ